MRGEAITTRSTGGASRHESAASSISARIKALALTSHDVFSLARYARQLATTPRTLQRRLRAEGTTYRTLLAEIRLELAVRALAHGSNASASVASGFADEASFYRAFKRWTGSTPRRFVATGSGERALPLGRGRRPDPRIPRSVAHGEILSGNGKKATLLSSVVRERSSGSRTRAAPAPSGAASPARVFVFPPFRLDALNEQLWRDDQLIGLRHRPLRILCYLLERPRELVTKEQLLRDLWPDEYVGEGVLATYLSEIRKALGDSARSSRFIETAHGRGYRFIGALVPERASSPPPPERARSSFPPPSGTAPFVGRQRELGILREALERASAARREVLFISGEAGIGKIQLVRAFLEQMGAEGAALVAWGQCVDQYGVGEPYLPVLEALSRLARTESALLVEVLCKYAPSWSALLPTVSVEHAVSERPVMPERMLREMAEALEVLTRDRVLILWLDDLQWADPSTLDLIGYVAQRGDPARLLLLTTHRREEARASERLVLLEQRLKLREQSRELALSYLDRDAVSAYLDERFPSHEFPDALAALLHRLTSGNPLFLVQVVTFWVERGALAPAASGWQLRQPLSELTRGIPETLMRMIELQLERLDALERSLLEAASVAGSQFCSAALSAALDEDIVRIEAVCTRWSRNRRFVRANGTAEWADGTRSAQFEFIHALYREALYEQIAATQRARLHRRIGERLESAYAARPAEVALELALHFERGHDPARAARYLHEAAGHALRSSAYGEAAEHLQRALELLSRLPEPAAARDLEVQLCLALGSALTVVRGYADPEVARVYARARGLCQSIGETPLLASVVAGIAGFFIVRGAHREGAELCEQLRTLAARHADKDAEAAGCYDATSLKSIRAASMMGITETARGVSVGQWASSDRLRGDPVSVRRS